MIRGTVAASAWSKWGKPPKKSVTVSGLQAETLSQDPSDMEYECCFLNTLRTGLLNCLNARSRGLTFRHRASFI